MPPSTPSINRSSLYTSSSTYPSTFSSQNSSALGLTESPLPPTFHSMAVLEDVRNRSEELRKQVGRKENTTPQRVRADEGRRMKVADVAARFEEIPIPKFVVDRLTPDATTPQRPSRPTSRQNLKHAASNQSIQHRASSQQLRKQASSLDIRPSPSRQTSTDGPRSGSNTQYSKANQPNVLGTSQVAIHRQPSPPKQITITSYDQQTSDIANEWETELLKSAHDLQIDPSKAVKQQSRDNLRAQVVDVTERGNEWAKRGQWEHSRERGRDAEDRTRRDALRAIAYPPAMPRAAIRAAPSGVTSVHVGVRPRLHPSRASDSMACNQPDSQIPEPLFSPQDAPFNLESGGGDQALSRGSYNTKYRSDILEKAKNEYQDWLAKKEEREGGVGEPGASAAAQFILRDRERVQARFGALQLGQYDNHGSQQDYSTFNHHNPQVKSKDPARILSNEEWQAQAYEAGGTGDNGPDDYYNQMMHYGGWDPAMYWYMMNQYHQMMNMHGLEGYGMDDRVSPITSEGSSGSGEDEKQPLVTFKAE